MAFSLYKEHYLSFIISQLMSLETTSSVKFCDWELGTGDWEKMEEQERDKDRGFESLDFADTSLDKGILL